MSIAASLVIVVMAASPPLAARPLQIARPITLTVSVPSNIPRSLVRAALGEAADLWRAAGLVLVWQLESDAIEAEAAETAELSNALRVARVRLPAPLRVVIDHATGPARTDAMFPLGWIVFDDGGVPSQNIHVSYANAKTLLRLTRIAAGGSDRMPPAEVETMLSRAMGRALAHELGHYLLASKAHSQTGLMRARRTAAEFFGVGRERFGVDADQRAAIAARLAGSAAIASVQPSVIGHSWSLTGHQSLVR